MDQIETETIWHDNDTWHIFNVVSTLLTEKT